MTNDDLAAANCALRARIAELEAANAELDESFRKLEAANAELEASNRELQLLSDHVLEQSVRDPLTSLFNRRQLFIEADLLLKLARRHERTLSVAMVDIDRFKAVNDRYYHSTGDAVLKEIAGLLTSGVRESDLVGRYGGDEFAILLPEVPASGAGVLCERIRSAVEDHDWTTLAEDLVVTVTIGIAEANGLESAEDLLHHADERLYLAKSLGRNRVAT